MRKLFLPLFLLVVLASSALAAPKNVIILIGDGMGIAHVTAARIVQGGPGSRLAMDSMSISGFVTTYSANSVVTDSAAAATAIATSTKTNNGTIGLTPDGKRVKSILEAARELGKSTGLVTTTPITDATPAGFAAHVENRSQQPEIAAQLVASGVNVLFGGGRSYFIPKSVDGSWREDDRDILAEAKSSGYSVISNEAELKAASGTKLLGLFAPGYLTAEAPEPPLAELADKAIGTLSKNNSKGFFLMVEGGQIDTKSHANDFDGMVKQLLDFDRAVACALDFARKDGNTLVIVTADHETGGLTLPKDDAGKLKPSWSSGGHSAVVVPLYAYGPSALSFAGLKDNTEISMTIAKMWKTTIGLPSK